VTRTKIAIRISRNDDLQRGERSSHASSRRDFRILRDVPTISCSLYLSRRRAGGFVGQCITAEPNFPDFSRSTQKVVCRRLVDDNQASYERSISFWDVFNFHEESPQRGRVSHANGDTRKLPLDKLHVGITETEADTHRVCFYYLNI